MERTSTLFKNVPLALLTAVGVGTATVELMATQCTSNTCGGCYTVVSGCSSCQASGCSASGTDCTSTCRYCSGQEPSCS
jgi:hypothetical protein